MSTTEEVVEAVNTAVDVVEDVASDVVTVTRNNPYILGAVAAVGITLGAFGGYHFAKKRMTAHYDHILQQEIDHAKKFYAQLHKADEPTVADAVKNRITPEEREEVVQAALALREYQGEEGVEIEVKGTDVEETEVVVKEENIFLKKDDFDYQEALEERLENGGEHPYVISHVEFMENDPEHEQESVTYFEGDDIVCDEKDESLEPAYTVGEDNLTKFGYGSNDNNVVYVRNEKLGIDYEILRSRGKYTREVLGVIDDEELSHSDRRRPSRRFRDRDEE